MFKFWAKPKRIYLDFAAATPVSKEVLAAMKPFWHDIFANPSAVHSEGLKSKSALNEARQEVATTLGIRPEEVFFTGSGTESNNLAITGLIKKIHRVDGVPYSEMEIITTKLEHPSIMELLPVLEATGLQIKYATVDETGKIELKSLTKLLSTKTVLLTFAYANSEIGVVQPVKKIAREVKRFNKEKQKKIYIHIDAAQAPLWLSCNLNQLGVDMMTLDTAKCFGPKGVGVLVLKGSVELLPILYGGGQESGLRPGTENVGNIVGAARALSLAQKNYKIRGQTVREIRDEAILLLLEGIPGALLNGPVGEDRLANNINISLPGFDTEYAVVYLDKHGVAASTKSACSGSGGGESLVVKVITNNTARSLSTLRFSLGPATTKKDFLHVSRILQQFQKLMQS